MTTNDSLDNNGAKPDEALAQEQLDGDDSDGAATSNDALLDGDTIGTALRDDTKSQD